MKRQHIGPWVATGWEQYQRAWWRSTKSDPCFVVVCDDGPGTRASVAGNFGLHVDDLPNIDYAMGIADRYLQSLGYDAEPTLDASPRDVSMSLADANAIADLMLNLLPKCDTEGCARVQTQVRTDQLRGIFCEECAVGPVEDLPYAWALRRFLYAMRRTP